MSSEIAAIQDAKRRSVLVYFLSASEDQKYSEEISKHLRSFIRDFPAKIELDSDFNIPAGADREQHKKQLFEADIVLALISSDFISDDDVHDRTNQVIERHNNKQTVIIPLLVRNCLWNRKPFSQLQVLPRNHQPLNNQQYWNSLDDAAVEVAKDICSSLNQLVQSGGVQLSSTDAAKPRPDPALNSEKAFDISGIAEVPGGASKVGSPISVDWRKKYNRFVVLKRGSALLIDYFVNLFIVVIVAFVAMIAVAGAAAALNIYHDLDSYIALLFGFVVTHLIICPMMESSRWCGTFGKIIMRIQITDRDGNRITFWRAFLRNVTRTVFSSILPFCFIWQIVRFRKTNKLFHDEWSGTVIGQRLARVKTRRSTVSGEANPADKKGALLTGLKSSRMRARQEARPQDLTTQERDFGQATIAHADAEERRKARQRRIITRASIAATVVLVCFAVAAGVAWNQAEQNAKQSDVAKVEAENQTQLANEAKEEADKVAKQADVAKVEAENQTRLANKAREQADEVAKQAEFERDKAIAALCLRVGRDLTKADWARYVDNTRWQPSCGAFGVPSNWQRQPADEAESDAAVLDDAPTKTQPAAPPASSVLRVKASPAPASASVDLPHIDEHKARTSEAPKDPGPGPALHPQPITHTASRGNIPASTGNTTAQLNQQELARHRSVAATPDNGILRFFGSIFH